MERAPTRYWPTSTIRRRPPRMVPRIDTPHNPTQWHVRLLGRALFPGLTARSRGGRIRLASNRRLSVPENVGGPLRGRLLKRPWPVRLVLVAALLLAVPFLFDAGAAVHAADNEITGVTVTSTNPGELGITWEAPSRTPTATTGSPGRSRRPSGPHTGTTTPSTVATPSRRARPTRCRTSKRGPNTACGCAPATTTPTTTSRRAVPGRTRPPVEVTVSSQLPSAENRSDKEQVPPRKSKKSPPLHDNLSYSLNELIRQNQSQGTSRGDRLPRDGGAVEESATVVVYVEAAHVQDVVLFLRNNGATVRSPDPGDDYLVAEVPLSLLPRLSQRPDVKFVKVDELVQQSGGPGATAHGAAPWDTAGYDGTGIKVGVIDTGFQRLFRPYRYTSSPT